MGKTRFPYPPCVIGLYSEKPGRHNFQIVLDENGHAQTTLKELKDGTIVTYYKSRCTKCGLNDPRSPLH